MASHQRPGQRNTLVMTGEIDIDESDIGRLLSSQLQRMADVMGRADDFVMLTQGSSGQQGQDGIVFYDENAHVQSLHLGR